MLNVKLQSATTLNNMKYYMFITNEYGLPSESNIDFFVSNFCTAIVNNNFRVFSSDEYRLSLDSWWEEIVQDLKERDMENVAKFSGGHKFIKKLALDSTGIKSEESLIEYLKNFDLSSLNEAETTVKDVANNKPESKENTKKYNTVDIRKLHHTGLNDWATNRTYLTLVCTHNGNQENEELRLNVKNGAVVVKKSNMTRLLNKGYFNFESYLLDYLSPIGDNERVMSLFTDIVNQIKRGEIWEVQVGKITMPLNTLFIWEDTQ